jgi:hypothetical protein
MGTRPHLTEWSVAMTPEPNSWFELRNVELASSTEIRGGHSGSKDKYKCQKMFKTELH